MGGEAPLLRPHGYEGIKTLRGGPSSSYFSRARSKAASTTSQSLTPRFGRSRKAAQNLHTERSPGEALRSTRRPFPASRGIRVAGKLFAASGPGWSVSGTFWRPKFTRAALRAPARSSSRRWERSRPPKSSINRAPLLCMRASPLIWRWARRQAPARRSTPFVLRCFAAPG